MHFNRRTVFGLGAAALATPTLLTRASHAQAPARPDAENAGFHRFMLGTFEVTVLLDGIRSFDGPHPIFGADREALEVAALMEQNFLPDRRMIGQFNPVLVNTRSELVLFDTGNGPEGREHGTGRLAERIVASGYDTSDVTMVVLSHLHADHINGLMEGDAPTFSQASYVVGREEWDFWTTADLAGTPAAAHQEAMRAKVLPFQDKMTFIEAGAPVVGGVSSLGAAGHTPGHLAFMLESEGRNLLLTGDTANHFVASLQKPDWEVVFDMDKGVAATTRRRIFGMLAAERIPFIGYHMPHPAAGYVEPFDEGFRYVPVSYQFLL